MTRLPDSGSRAAALVVLCLARASASQAPKEEASPPGPLVELDGRLFPDFAPLPPVPHPPDNPPDPRKVELGRTLFFDKRLSGDGKLSCSSCHKPDVDFTNELPKARGRGGVELFRRVPSLKNTAYNAVFFWDGRADTLESQFFEVLRNPAEMDMDPRTLVERLDGVPEYRAEFRGVFGAEGVSSGTISRAVSAYERTLLVKETVFDRFVGGDAAALNGPSLRGMALFKGKARCIVCHHGPTLSDGKFHNTGLRPARGAKRDSGRERVDGDRRSRGKFRTPMLRNSTRNTPYMHDGSIGAIEDLLEFYNRGGDVGKDLDPDIRPLNLTRREILQLKAFLYTLGEIGGRNLAPYEHQLSPEEAEVYANP